MKLKVKKLIPQAVLPYKAHAIDAGYDLVATSKEWDEKNGVLVFGTGLAIEIPVGHVGLLLPRSSVYKTGLSLCNSCGVLDAGYQGEVKFMFYPGRAKENYEVNNRIGQLVVVPLTELTIVEVSELSKSDRGTNGHGSSGV